MKPEHKPQSQGVGLFSVLVQFRTSQKIHMSNQTTIISGVQHEARFASARTVTVTSDRQPRWWDIVWQDGSHSLFPFSAWSARQVADLKQATSAVPVY